MPAQRKTTDVDQTAAGAAAEPQSEVVRALRLGWLTSEVYGLVRRGALAHAPRRRPPEKRTGRLSISDRNLKHDVTWLELDLRALLQLAASLDVFDPAREDTALHTLAGRVLKFLAQPRADEPPTLSEVYAGLEAWSMDAWGALAARNELAARAFSYGASIADTFWFMHDPRTEQPPESDKETWARLLRYRRLRVEGERIGELEAHLPAHVAVSLKHSLLKWGIEGELKRKYTPPTGEGRQVVLEPGVECKIFLALRAQTRIWRSIILGERTPGSFLDGKHVRRARVWHIATFALLTALALFVLSFLIWGGLRIVGPLFFGSVWNLILNLQPQGQAPKLELKDVISSLSILAVLLGGLWTTGRWLFEQQFKLYEWVGKKAVERYIKQRTWVPWDRHLRS